LILSPKIKLWRLQIMQFLILSSFVQSPVPSSLLGPTYSQTFSSLRFSFNWRDQVSHPHKTGEEIFPFLYSKLPLSRDVSWSTMDVRWVRFPKSVKQSLQN
jgi:hypothetical protein